MFFRDMYHQICLLIDSKLADNFKSMLDLSDDDKLDGLLTYGYIDATAGFTFGVLGGAKLDGERVKIFPLKYNEAAFVRRGAADEVELRILTADYALAFRDRIQMVNDGYFVGNAKEQTRMIKTLDAFRHPHYPDDVTVYFLDGEHKPELMWVRCVSVDENILTGELLNEPRSDFGYHAGDEIKFGVAQVNGQNILLNLPTKS